MAAILSRPQCVKVMNYLLHSIGTTTNLLYVWQYYGADEVTLMNMGKFIIQINLALWIYQNKNVCTSYFIHYILKQPNQGCWVKHIGLWLSLRIHTQIPNVSTYEYVQTWQEYRNNMEAI